MEISNAQASVVDDTEQERLSTPEPIVSSVPITTSLHHQQPETSIEEAHAGEESEASEEAEESEEGEAQEEEEEEGEGGEEEAGPEWLEEYLLHLGDHTLIAAVTLRFRTPQLADSLTDAGRVPVKESIEEYILRAVNPEEEDLGITFRTLRGNLVANGRVKLPRGLTLSACEAALRDAEAKQTLVDQINRRLTGGGSAAGLTPDQIDVDVFESTSDDFFRWDVNLDTTLEFSEFLLASDEMLGLHYNHEKAEEVFTHLDINHDHRLSADEFFVQSGLEHVE